VKGRFSEAQILGFLREAAAGTPIMELCWNHCFSRSTFRAWKARYGGAIEDALLPARLKSENARLRRSLAQTQSDLERLRPRQWAEASEPQPRGKSTGLQSYRPERSAEV
jgi:putative transposase